MPGDKIIIVVSNEPWGKIWYSKQNWAYELSKKNNIVFFLSPPPGFKIFNIFRKPVCKKIYDNLYDISYFNFLPLTVKLLCFSAINDFVTGLKIARTIRLIAGKKDKILFSFDPFRFLKPSSLKVKKSLFFYVDVYKNKGLKKILNNVDFVVTVSKELSREVKNNTPVLTLSHGISTDEFSVTKAEMNDTDIKIPAKDYCIYVGAIDHKIDYELIKRISRAYPELLFLFIGPVSKVLNEQYKQLFNNNTESNILYYPPVFFKKLKYYIANARFAIAPLSSEFGCYMINSHKLLQYFALGKPVLSPLFAEYRDKQELIYSYNDELECIQQIQNILSNEPDELLMKKRIDFASQHTYSRLLKKIDIYFERKHICYTIATGSHVPYFSWFMHQVKINPTVRFSFIILDNKKNELVQEIERNGMNAYLINFCPDKRKRHMIMAALKMFFIFRKIRPDVVHSQLFDDAVPSMFAARLARIRKRVITKQDTAYHYNYVRKWVMFDKFNNANSTHVIAVSNEAGEFIEKVEKCPARKRLTIHHGVDPKQFLYPDIDEKNRIRKLYADENSFIVGTLARFIHWKNYHHIIEAAEICIRRHSDIVFAFWGSGELKEEVQNLIVQKGIENNVKIAEYYPRDKIQNVYAALDVYLHAAHMEPFGFVIAEAMMSGLPVVSTSTGAAKDAITHKQNGWLAEYNDINGLVDGIEYFYMNKVNKPWKPSRETAVKMYDISRMFEDYLKVYNS